MKPLLIFKVGETFSQLSRRLGDFEHWTKAGLGQLECRVAVFDPRSQEPLPHFGDVAGAVITGSHAMVTDRARWSENLAHWLASLVEHGIPVLGICYGHQLLAHALGGEVGYRPNGREVGTVRIQIEEEGFDDELFESLRDDGTFLAHAFHSQRVHRLPPGAVVLARSDLEPHAAFRIGPCAWGVQFHPEFCERVMAGYIHCLEAELAEEGHDIYALLAGLAPTGPATLILERFGSLVERRYQTSFRPTACD